MITSVREKFQQILLIASLDHVASFIQNTRTLILTHFRRSRIILSLKSSLNLGKILWNCY